MSASSGKRIGEPGRSLCHPPSLHCVLLIDKGGSSPLFIRDIALVHFRMSVAGARNIVRCMGDYRIAALGELTAEVAEHKADAINELAAYYRQPLKATLDRL